MSASWRIDLGAIFLYLALGSMFSAIPRYVTEQLGESKALAGFAVSVFFLAAVVARPLAGRFADRRGRRPMLVLLPFVIAAAFAGLHLAREVGPVLALRLVQGFAGGAFYVAAVTAETDLAPPDRRASAVARLSVAIYLGFAAGPLVGEWLTDRGSGWTWTVASLLAVVAGLLTTTVPETRPALTPAPVDATVVVPTGSQPPAVTTPTADGPAPFIYPAAVLPGITLLTLGVGYATITSLSALYARAIGLDSSEPLYLAFALSILVVRLVSGRVADTVGPVRVIFPGLASFVAGFACLSLLDVPAPAVVGVTLVGVGWALVFPATIAWLTGTVPLAHRGAALGTLVAFMDVGQGAGGYLVGAVADRQGFSWAYLVPALLAACGTVVMVAAVRRTPEPLGTGTAVP